MTLFVFSDVSGGESPSILVAIRDCIKASNVLSFGKSEDYKPLNFEEAFFLATLGGSQGKLSMKQLNYCQTLKCAVAENFPKEKYFSVSFTEAHVSTVSTTTFCSIVKGN